MEGSHNRYIIYILCRKPTRVAIPHTTKKYKFNKILYPTEIQKNYTPKNEHYLISHNLLIQDLSTNIAGIPLENVKVFAFGKKCKIEHEKPIIVHLGLNDSHKTKMFTPKEEKKYLPFEYFEDMNELSNMILGTIKKPGSHITIFIEEFVSLTPLNIYLSLLMSKPSSIRIFSESNQRFSISYLVEILDKFIGRIERAGIKEELEFISLTNLMPIFRAASKTGEDSERAFDSVEETVNLIKTHFGEQLDLLIDVHKRIYKMPEYKKAILNPKDSIEELRNQIPTNYFHFKSLINFMKGLGFNIGQYHRMNAFIKACRSYKNFAIIINKITEKHMIDIARKIFKAGTDNNFKKFIEEIFIIDSQNIDPFLYLSKLYIHKDVKIFSSSHIEDNDNINLMGSFIKEVIKYSKEEYFEFALPRIPSRGKRISREWVRPCVSVYGSECNTYDLFADENIIMDIICEDSSDDYYDEEDKSESYFCDTLRELSEDRHQSISISKEEIAKLQKSVSLKFSWDCNVYNIWLIRFQKLLKKKYGIEFNPNANIGDLRGGMCINFLQTYNHINEYLPIHTLSRMYYDIRGQIEKLLLENQLIDDEIMELIGECFDDADRVVTPLFFEGKKKYTD